MKPKNLEPGYGYRFLEDDEVVRPGDQYRGISQGEYAQGWLPVGPSVGTRAGDYAYTAFRRRIKNAV